MKKGIVTAFIGALLLFAISQAADAQSVAVKALQRGGSDYSKPFNTAEKTTARWAVSTNLVDWAFILTPNVTAQFSVHNKVTLTAEAKLNYWKFLHNTNPDAEFRNMKNSIGVGMRYWFWYTYSGWWAGVSAKYMEYNYGGVFSRMTEEGDAYGAGLYAGYSFMVNKNFNIDFGIGGWGGIKQYRQYSCPTCGVMLDEGKKPFIAPDEALISLMFIF